MQGESQKFVFSGYLAFSKFLKNSKKWLSKYFAMKYLQGTQNRYYVFLSYAECFDNMLKMTS